MANQFGMLYMKLFIPWKLLIKSGWNVCFSDMVDGIYGQPINFSTHFKLMLHFISFLSIVIQHLWQKITSRFKSQRFFNGLIFLLGYSKVPCFPANSYLFKLNYRNTRKSCEICSKLKIRTRRSCFFIVNFTPFSSVSIAGLWASKFLLGLVFAIYNIRLTDLNFEKKLFADNSWLFSTGSHAAVFYKSCSKILRKTYRETSTVEFYVE